MGLSSQGDTWHHLGKAKKQGFFTDGAGFEKRN